MSRQNDQLYNAPAALEAFDAATFADSAESRLGTNGFLGAGDLAYFEETLRKHAPVLGAPGSATEGTLVDLGCGRGALGRYLAERLGVNLVGIDPSNVALDQAREVKTSVRVRWLSCDFADTQLESGSAAYIVSLDGIHMATDPRAMLREVARIAMPGAPLIFTVCVPRFRQGALDWQNGLRDHSFKVLEYLEVSEAWHAWLRKKHERRLHSATELGQRLEEREAAQAIEASKAMLAGEPPFFTTQRRFRITARRE